MDVLGNPKTATINALVSLSLDPDSVDTVDKNGGKGFIQVKYHKDQANDKDYSHQGIGFHFKVNSAVLQSPLQSLALWSSFPGRPELHHIHAADLRVEMAS